MKLAFWRKKETESGPLKENEITSSIKVLPKAPPAVLGDHTAELQYLNQLNALDELAARLRTRKREPFNKWIPSKVTVAWFDRAFTVLHIREMQWKGDGLVSDNWWGRAADILGPNTKPITISQKGKVAAGFLVDGDKGVGFNIERKPDGKGAYAHLGTTSELAWQVLDTQKFKEAFGSGVTSRTLWVVSIVVLIMGALIGHSIK